jgi:hypothetical protein
LAEIFPQLDNRLSFATVVVFTSNVQGEHVHFVQFVQPDVFGIEPIQGGMDTVLDPPKIAYFDWFRKKYDSIVVKDIFVVR